MSEIVVVYFFKVGARQGLERRFGTNQAFTTLYGRSRGWAKGGVYLSSSGRQFMGATLLGKKGARAHSRYTQTWPKQSPIP
jgi:hypothetical protein